MKKTKVTAFVLAAVLSSTPVLAAEVPKEAAPINATEESRRGGKSCVKSIKTNLLGENYGRNNFYQGGFST